jgi:hypothetical protein
MRNFRRFAIGVALATVWVGSALPALAAENGTVDAQVTVATPCILVDPPSIDFGSLPFRSPTNPVISSLSPLIQLTNCGAGPEQMFGRGTDATIGGNPVWTLGPYGPCSGGLNEYSLRAVSDYDIAHPIALTTTDQVLDIAAGGNPFAVRRLDLVMPCTGSDGVGQIVTFQAIFTATF